MGEIFLNSVDRDGKKNGYEIEILKEISEKIKIPIIACGGAGSWSDMYEFMKTDCDGIAASNIFSYQHNVFWQKNICITGQTNSDLQNLKQIYRI